MTTRIISSLWYISSWIKKVKKESKKEINASFTQILPSVPVASVLAATFAITMGSYIRGTKIIIHLSLGALCFGVFALATFKYEKSLFVNLKKLHAGEL